MDLYPTSVEYATISIAADIELDGLVEWAFTGRTGVPGADTIWHPATWIGAPAKQRSCQLLLAGFDAADAPGDAVKLTGGEHQVYVRFPDLPEVIIRKSGSISVRAA